MTSTAVTEKNQIFMEVTGNRNVPGKQGTAFMDCFSQAYGGQAGSGMQNAQTVSAPQKSENIQPKPNYHKDKLQTGKDSVADPVTGNAVADDTSVKADITDEVEEASEEVIEAIASELGISMEAVREMMLQNGMTPADLLDPKQVTGLMLELAGNESSLDLLTNGQLYEDVEQVMQKLEDVLGQLSEELQVDPEQLKDMIRNAKEQMTVQADVPQQGIPQEDTQHTESGENMAELSGRTEQAVIQPAAQTAQAGEAADRNGRTDAQEEPVITVENEKPLETVAKQETTPGQDGGKENFGRGQKGQAEGGQTGPDQYGAFAPGKTDMNALVQELTATVHQAPDTEQIMKQIMDYMKVQVKADMTQMEIQLHPSTLGNVNIHISSREGVITAQFTAQNEAVKTALETQIVQLKESLADQGVKVEAVEVTIASHSFERNLQQDSGQGSEEKPERKNGPKRLNLNLLAGEEPEEELMEEADRIAVEMMTRNGNTIDFSA